MVESEIAYLYKNKVKHRPEYQSEIHFYENIKMKDTIGYKKVARRI